MEKEEYLEIETPLGGEWKIEMCVCVCVCRWVCSGLRAGASSLQPNRLPLGNQKIQFVSSHYRSSDGDRQTL